MTKERAKEDLPPIDLKKCKTKMDALKRHYKRLKDSKNRSGSQTITWPYYGVSQNYCISVLQTCRSLFEL